VVEDKEAERPEPLDTLRIRRIAEFRQGLTNPLTGLEGASQKGRSSWCPGCVLVVVDTILKLHRAERFWGTWSTYRSAKEVRES